MSSPQVETSGSAEWTIGANKRWRIGSTSAVASKKVWPHVLQHRQRIEPMKKLMIAAAALALIGSASAATVMTDSQMDSVTAGWKKSQSLAIALGGSSASASGGSTNVAAAAHLNYTKTAPGKAYAASAGIAVSYSSGKTGCGCGHAK
jgi:hypothetical protein